MTIALKYGRPLEVPETWEEHYEVASFFTREAGDTLAGGTLDEPVYGYAASISEPGGMARAFLAIVKSLGLQGFDIDTFETDLDHPILLEGVDYWVRLVEDTFPPRRAHTGLHRERELFRRRATRNVRNVAGGDSRRRKRTGGRPHSADTSRGNRQSGGIIPGKLGHALRSGRCLPNVTFVHGGS